jgi:hypothetical protein
MLIPEIIRRILDYSTPSTIATCMRVSQYLHDIAAELLYTRLEIFNGNALHIFKGAAYTEPDTLPNRKLALLKHTKYMDILWHWHCTIHHGKAAARAFNKLRVLTISTYSKCTCGDHCDICKDEYHDDGSQICPLLNWITADKVVLANLREMNASTILRRIQKTIIAAKTVTIIVSPDNRGIEALSLFLQWLGKRNIRVILAPWSERTHDHTIECVQEDRQNSDTKVDKAPATIKRIVEVLAELYAGSKRVEVYFIEGATFPYPYRRDDLIELPDMASIKQRLITMLRDEEVGEFEEKRMAFKTRADYLSEGWVDEIDPRELQRWRDLEYGPIKSIEPMDMSILEVSSFPLEGETTQSIPISSEVEVDNGVTEAKADGQLQTETVAEMSTQVAASSQGQVERMDMDQLVEESQTEQIGTTEIGVQNKSEGMEIDQAIEIAQEENVRSGTGVQGGIDKGDIKPVSHIDVEPEVESVPHLDTKEEGEQKQAGHDKIESEASENAISPITPILQQPDQAKIHEDDSSIITVKEIETIADDSQQ